MNKPIFQNSEKRKGEVPDAFRRIRATLMERKPKPYDRYTPAGLEEERKEAAKELRDFWYEQRPRDIDRRSKIFEDPYHWSESHYFAAVEMDRREELLHPSEELMRLFVLLSDPPRSESPELIGLTFSIIDWPESNIKQSQLVQMLNPNTLSVLVGSVDGQGIAGLLTEAGQYDLSHRTWLVEKIAEILANGSDGRHLCVSGSEQELGNYLVLNPDSSVIGILRHASSKSAHDIAGYLVRRLEEAKRWIQRTLDALKGEQHA